MLEMLFPANLLGGIEKTHKQVYVGLHTSGHNITAWFWALVSQFEYMPLSIVQQTDRCCHLVSESMWVYARRDREGDMGSMLIGNK